MHITNEDCDRMGVVIKIYIQPSYITKPFHTKSKQTCYMKHSTSIIIGLSFETIACIFTVTSIFLDFNFPGPAIPKFGDLADPRAHVNTSITGICLFYLLLNFPTIYLWSSWDEFITRRRKKTCLIFTLFQTAIGLITLGITGSAATKSNVLYFTSYELRGFWAPAIGMLAISVLLNLICTLIAFVLFCKSESEQDSGKKLGEIVINKKPEQALDSKLGEKIVINKESEQASDSKLVINKESEQASDSKLGNMIINEESETTLDPVSKTKCCKKGFCYGCNICCSQILFIIFLALVGLAIDYRIHEPDTSCFAILPTNSNPLTITPSLLSVIVVGDYFFKFSSTSFQVNRNEVNLVFQTLDDESFLRAGIGPFKAKNDHEMGTFEITDNVHDVSNSQTINDFNTDNSTFLTLAGTLSFTNFPGILPYTITFTISSGTNHLAYHIQLNGTALQATTLFHANDRIRTYWISDSAADERFFGFGETYSSWDLKSTCVPIITREQGIGRGMQPFSYLINRLAHHGAGSWQTTYSAVPHYITSKIRSMFFEESIFLVYDLTKPDRVRVEILATDVRGRFIAEQTVLDVIQQYTLFSGRMRPLPDWVGSGAIIGLQGGTDVVSKQVNMLLELQVPLAGVWLQDWSGKRETSFGDRLLWNWEINNSFYPGWYDFIRSLRAKNISMLTYINPYLADLAPDSTGTRIAQPMYLEAKSLNCLVLNENNQTLIQVSATEDFTFATVDITNPVCEDWFIGKIRTNMMNITAAENGQAFGALGWMADFAESIPFSARLFKGDGEKIHNIFPALWAETCRKAINITSGNVDFSKEVTFFTRSSSPKSPQSTTLMWLGDQMQAFNDFDGIQTVIPAAASHGLSGFSLTHSDVGGYLGVSQFRGLIRLTRSKELLLRWMELSAFMDSIFRSHEGNVPKFSPQITSDNQTMIAFARFAKIFKALHPYRKILMNEASTLGYPLARHPFLHYQNDRELDLIKSQIMLGSELMICPALSLGVNSVSCYLPKNSGIWIEFFDGTSQHDSSTTGLKFTCNAPLGRPCVLMKQSAVHVPLARQTLVNENFAF